jgi:hypothetical protein
MKKRLDAGIFDQNNVSDLFGYMNTMGLNDTQKFQAVESLTGGSLKANQIEALVGRFGNAEGIAQYRALMATDPAAAEAQLKATMTDAERAAYEGGGMTKLGASKTSMAERREADIESLMLEVGNRMIPAVSTLSHVAERLIHAAGNLLDWLTEATGVDGSIDKILQGVERAADATERSTTRLPDAAPQESPEKRVERLTRRRGGWE